jgi:hypothetical protein
MITLTSAKRRAEEFAAAVDAPTTSPARADLAELVGVVATLRAHPTEQATPRADFSAALRERLMTEAEATWTYDPSAARLTLPARPTGRRERRLAAAATALVLAGGTAGVAAAAQQALPGEALYPLKRGIEDVRADLTGDDAAKGRTLLDQAFSRLAEARTLVDESGNDPAVGSTIDTFRSQAVTGSGLLLDSYEDTGDEAAVSEVRAFAEDGLVQLEALSTLVPADLQAPIEDAALALQEIELRAAEACPTCGSDDALTTASSAFRPALDDAARALAALEGEALSNDHPLISNRLFPDAPKRGDREAQGSDGVGADTGAPAGDAAEDVTGGGGVGDGLSDTLNDGLGDVDANGPDVTAPLREVEKTVKDSADSVKEQVDKVTGKTGETVDGVEESLEGVTDPLRDSRLP